MLLRKRYRDVLIGAVLMLCHSAGLRQYDSRSSDHIGNENCPAYVQRWVPQTWIDIIHAAGVFARATARQELDNAENRWYARLEMPSKMHETAGSRGRTHALY